MGQRRAAVPLEGAELYERLEALRRRNRGGRQRARENLRARQASSGGDGGPVTSAPAQQPVAEVPADFTLPEEEDWEAAIMEVDLLLEEDLEMLQNDQDVRVNGVAAGVDGSHEEWLVVPYVPPPPPEVELLPRGIPVHEFAREVVGWAGLSGPDMLARARANWRIEDEEDLPRLRLALQLVSASTQQLAFDMLETIQQQLLEDPSGATVIWRVVNDLVVMAASR